VEGEPDMFDLLLQVRIGIRLGLGRESEDKVEVVETEVAELGFPSPQGLCVWVQLGTV